MFLFSPHNYSDIKHSFDFAKRRHVASSVNMCGCVGPMGKVRGPRFPVFETSCAFVSAGKRGHTLVNEQVNVYTPSNVDVLGFLLCPGDRKYHLIKHVLNGSTFGGVWTCPLLDS